MSSVINAAIVTNAPAPYRVPGWRRLAAAGDIHLDVIYCTQPHIDTSLNAAVHGFGTHFLTGRYWAMERRFMHCDPAVWSMLNQLRPDVVITTGFIPTYLFAFAWAAAHGVPHVAMTDGTVQSEKSLSWLHRLVRRMVFSRSAAFVGASEGSRDLFRLYGVPEDRIHTSRLCADNDQFLRPRAATTDFLFCGRFVAHKRPLFAMQVVREVSIRMGRRSSIDFVGSGAMEPALRDYAAEIADFVDTRFHGYAAQAELPSHYAGARIFLFPTEADPWGVVANEACAAGLPVIISPHAGSAGEIVQDGRNGYVRELDVAQWAAAAVALLKDEALYRRFSQSSREMVAGYTFDHAARGLADAIRQAYATRKVDRPENSHSARPILIATLMRPEGDTGVQTHFRSLMAYLDKTDRQCNLITPYDAPLWQVYPAFGLRKLVSLFSSEWGVWWYRHWHAFFLRQALRRRLQTGAPCVVYAQCPLSAHAAIRARGAQDQRVVMVAHFNISQADEWAGKGLIQSGGRLYRAIRDFEGAVLPQLDGLVFVSDFMRHELAGRIPAITRVASAVVPNFLPDPGLPESGLPDMQTMLADLICIGTLEARKNQQYLLDIIAALRELGQPMTLTIVGDGADRRALEDRARSLKLNGLVHFAGYHRNAAEYIGRHRAYIHVATMESFGITLIEAMARGRPVFAAAVGGIPEVLGDCAGGLALPLHDARAAARIVADAMGNPDWMAAARNAARMRFLKEYSSDIAAKRLIQFLES